MPAQTRFLSVEDVVLIQADTLGHEGGLAGIRDRGLLESAVMMARQQFGGVLLHRTLAEQAAAYLFHLCRNHPFNDGNKRAAVLAALVFLDANEVGPLPEPGPLEELTMRCAAGEIGKDEVTAFFRSQLKAVAASKRKKSPGRKRGEDRRR
jgi:death-on-curing protein